MVKPQLKSLLLSSFAAVNHSLASVAAWVGNRVPKGTEPRQGPTPDAIRSPVQEPAQEALPKPIPEPVRKEPHDMETVKSWPRERLELMVRLMAQGTSIPETAVHLGVSVDDVELALRTLPDNLAGASQPGQWPGRKVAVLLRGLAEHRTYSEISREVGQTPGATSCKARRLRRLGQLRGEKSPKKPVGAAPVAVSPPAAPKEPEETFAALPAPKGDRKPPYGERSILDMTFNSCRWPTGQTSSGQHMFCGRPREEKYAWCACHALMAHTFALGGEAERARVERRAKEQAAAGKAP